MDIVFKKIAFIISLYAFALMGCEDTLTKEFEVRHDCTGSYLKNANGDLKVCNSEILEQFASGDFINVTYTITNAEECPSVNNFPCKLYHAYSEVIYVEKVNQ
jgi:hypothetical protein